MKRLVVFALAAALAACTPPAPAPLAPPPPAAAEILGLRAETLPGARVQQEGALIIAYPEQTLFTPGAAMPLAGGLEVLDPLARFLGDHRGNRWQVTVRAASPIDQDYDRALAAARSELLQRFLRNRGVAVEQFDWLSEAGGGPSLELRLQ